MFEPSDVFKFEIPTKDGTYYNSDISMPTCAVVECDLFPFPPRVDLDPREINVGIVGGGLAIFGQIAKETGLPMPLLDKLLCSNNNAMYADACRFYAVETNDVINLLRLHAFGGGMKAWLSGMSSGMFYTQGGTLIGTTVPKNITNGSKDNRGYWKRPFGISSLCRELVSGNLAIAKANAKLRRQLAAVDDSDDFVNDSRVVTAVVQACQIHVLCDLAQAVSPITRELVEIAPSRLTFIGPPEEDAEYRTEALLRTFSKFKRVCVWTANKPPRRDVVAEKVPVKATSPWGLKVTD
jgi:hypothetical protein